MPSGGEECRRAPRQEHRLTATRLVPHQLGLLGLPAFDLPDPLVQDGRVVRRPDHVHRPADVLVEQCVLPGVQVRDSDLESRAARTPDDVGETAAVVGNADANTSAPASLTASGEPVSALPSADSDCTYTRVCSLVVVYASRLPSPESDAATSRPGPVVSRSMVSHSSERGSTATRHRFWMPSTVASRYRAVPERFQWKRVGVLSSDACRWIGNEAGMCEAVTDLPSRERVNSPKPSLGCAVKTEIRPSGWPAAQKTPPPRRKSRNTSRGASPLTGTTNS